MISKKIIGISLSVIFISNISCPLVYAETIRPDKVKISIPTNMPSFNQSLSKTYQNALDTLKQEGFEVNNIPKENSVINPMEDLFSQKFPNNKTLTIEDVQNKFKEVDNGFSNKYENSKPENLPSKEATLIWDKNKILNSATKPKGFEEAIKETQGPLKGGISESFKNNVEGQIGSILNNIKVHQNDKPTKPIAPSVSIPNTPKAPIAAPAIMPNRPKGEKPPMPELVIPKQEPLNLVPPDGWIFDTPSPTPSTAPSTAPSTVPSTAPSMSVVPSYVPNFAPSKEASPVSNPLKTPSAVPTGGLVPKKEKVDTGKNKYEGSTWGKSLGTGVIATGAIYAGVKIARTIAAGVVTGGPGAVISALAP